MSKKMDKLRRLVQKLGTRYGMDDVDVVRLRQELEALEAMGKPQIVERRKAQVCRYNFDSVARQHFHAAKPPIPH